MPTSTSGIAYDEINPSATRYSPREQWRPDGTFVAVRTLKCAWSDREALIADMGASGGEAYPNLPSSPALAASANVVAQGVSFPSGDVLAHDWAMIEVYYVWSPYLPAWINSTLVSETITGVKEHTRLDPERLVWKNEDGGLKPLQQGEAPGVSRTLLRYSVTFYRIAYESQSHYTNMDTCNANVIQPYTLNIQFPIETLAYQEPDVRRSLGLAGLSKVDVTLSYLYTPHGWNRWYRAEHNQWEKVFHFDAEGDGRVVPLTPVVY